MGLFEDDYNEHELAWMSGDEDKIKAAADLFKESPENVFFMIVKSIDSKKKIDISTLDYNAYMLEQHYSHFPECITSIYRLNILGKEFTAQQHYNYLFESIPQGNKFRKASKLQDNNLDTLINSLIMKLYCMNNNDALMYRDILDANGKLPLLLKKLKPLVTDSSLSCIKNVKDRKAIKAETLKW
ncbi:DNA polymerase clamp loader subunit [Shewanella phage Thanatos-1]|nr:DNA polymerase clamp loader subunit [Shewanella phage Thanatos-1]QLA10624.1 DNA polymerase clamp loader subunit [Shewanella phage Thanatos-2]